MKQIPLPERSLPSGEELHRRSTELLREMRLRRTVRDFSDRQVPQAVIETCIRVATTAPSGANRQPWHFCAVAEPAVKARIRRAAESEERAFYQGRAPSDWLEALAPLGTDEHKPFLEVAPWLIVIFAQQYGLTEEGAKVKNYYVNESVGIATGMLLTALHLAGLATLTHTPAPMRFLNEILKRPRNERPYLILVTGYPAPGARVPAISKKGLREICDFVD